MNSLLLIAFVSFNTIASQIILKKGITTIDSSLYDSNKVFYLFSVMISPYTILAVTLQLVGYLAWIFVISKEKLGVSFAISGSFFYLMMAAASYFFYGEKITLVQFFGMLLISSGVLMVTYSAN